MKKDLLEKIRALPVYDTHEHVYSMDSLIKDPLGFFQTYLSTDLISAGIDSTTYSFILDPERPLSSRWKAFEPFWRRVEHTGYDRVIKKAFEACFAVDRINLEGMEVASYKLSARPRESAFSILREEGNIRGGVLCLNEFPYRIPIYSRTWEISPKVVFLIEIHTRDNLERLSHWVNIDVPRSLEEVEELLRACLSKLEEMGARVLKCIQAYQRYLNYEFRERREAKAAFEALMKGDSRCVEGRDAYALQDFLFEIKELV